jgi:DNA invertase Pin-like site-specific DNA recombinase
MTRSAGSGIRRSARVRCAIYTHKSSEEGLQQEFNSLRAQREACEAFINSQRHEGWVCLRAACDDGGFSGATLDRPALQRLLADIAAGRVDTVVVYKIDRLTRSLADFAKIVEILDRRGASFVSVTQQFNTTTSMGRLTLNVLLSFAQFEREVIGERIRDKIAASPSSAATRFPLRRLPSAKASARPVSLVLSASAISRRISPTRFSMAAARSDSREAARALTSAARLARSADRARFCLSPIRTQNHRYR